eukprot:355017-Chlamydomonas_euryale.AAC.4
MRPEAGAVIYAPSTPSIRPSSCAAQHSPHFAAHHIVASHWRRRLGQQAAKAIIHLLVAEHSVGVHAVLLTRRGVCRFRATRSELRHAAGTCKTKAASDVKANRLVDMDAKPPRQAGHYAT